MWHAMERGACSGMVGKPKDLEDIGIDGKIILKWILGK